MRNPQVHNKYHNSAPADAIYIGRGSPYGNPFVIGKDGSRDDVCDKYSALVEGNEKLKSLIKRELRGKHLVCFCKPQRCHGDYILNIANE
jgi:hypothetical protein